MSAGIDRGGVSPPASLLAGLSRTWPLAVLVTLVGAALTALLVRPAIGIDDANITHIYARNIASGLGYVYTPGGEHVEGSTSLLWTLINVLFFAVSPTPEAAIAGLCFALTVISVAYALKSVEVLSDLWSCNREVARLCTAFAFTLFPGFFVWSVWTLMDLTIWVLEVVLLVYAALRIIAATAQGQRVTRDVAAIFVIVCALLPITRPEGVAVAVGLALAGVGYFLWRRHPEAAKLCGLAALTAVVVTAAVTAWRLSYFGYPFPNTFYAKVSTGFVPQFLQGADYVISFVLGKLSPVVLAIVSAFSLFVWLSPATGKADQVRRDAVTLIVLVIIGVCLVYAVLGGDHFILHRFLQPLSPLLAMLTGLAAAWAWRLVSPKTWRPVAVAVVTATLVGLGTFARFMEDANYLANDFRLAEEGRQVGRLLNDLPGEPTIGVTAAGGAGLTYEGKVYDVLGLNWVEMAHAVSDKSGFVRNHGAFAEKVFMAHQPDLLLPGPVSIRSCDDRIWPMPGTGPVLKGMLSDPVFNQLYQPGCFNGVRFFIHRDLAQRLGSLVQTPTVPVVVN